MLFPTFGSFGPLFIVLGLEAGGQSYFRLLAFIGALMTSGALLILFRSLVCLSDQHSNSRKGPQA